ncbi:hypothetical protein [Arcobacter sp. LA11]|uniref:hypothetical protein n=1 Tax=Arcobacter sp. LA11 TaxID=1898176 RepID=UPI0009330AF3|nr:hypothetical protein [Arcobacter sp. LA11]
MDVNSINNNIASLNSVPQQHIDRANSTEQINNNDPFLKLSISDYNKKRDELSQSLQAFNEGIGISKTAQNGLEKQQEYLQNIQEKLTDLKNDDNIDYDKNTQKNDVNLELLKFREEAFQTKYKNENLIAIDDYEDDLTVNIFTKEAYFSIDKPNTPDIASQLAQEISNTDFNNTDALEETINKVENSINQLQNLKDQFTDLGNKLESSARVSIQEQVELSNQNRANKNINFGNEVNDFSKTNIQANVGYLAASQANIVQEQSVRLLS